PRRVRKIVSHLWILRHPLAVVEHAPALLELTAFAFLRGAHDWGCSVPAGIQRMQPRARGRSKHVVKIMRTGRELVLLTQSPYLHSHQSLSGFDDASKLGRTVGRPELRLQLFTVLHRSGAAADHRLKHFVGDDLLTGVEIRYRRHAELSLEVIADLIDSL